MFTRSRRQTSFVGFAIFMGAWAMMLFALLFAYADVRLHAPGWPPAGEPLPPRDVPALATLVLATASFTLERARRRGDASVRSPVVLDLLFLALQSLVWWQLWTAGLRVSSLPGSIFWTLTVFHAAHIIVAMLGLVLGARERRRYWALFQHALFVAWLLIFVTVYLV